MLDFQSQRRPGIAACKSDSRVFTFSPHPSFVSLAMLAYLHTLLLAVIGRAAVFSEKMFLM
jgi:hypothetical protein